MGKYAVVIGINYVNHPEAKLEGCCNDARLVYDMLMRKGFDDDNIKMLIDDDDSYDMPNHVNVKKALNWLCEDRSEEDVVFMHFSGHGTQIPSDGDDEEEDNKDEAIVLDELFLMADDDLKQYFSKIPEGTNVTVVTDCCHSGTMLDGEQVLIEGPKDSSSVVAQQESDELIEALGGSRGYEISVNRSLPIETIASVMSQKLGADVQPNNSGISGAMAQVFGGSAGKLMFNYAMKLVSKNDDSGQMSSLLSSAMGGLMGGGNSTSHSSGNPLSSMLGGLMGKPPAPEPESSNPFSSFLGGGGGSGGSDNPLGGMMSSFLGGGGGQEAPPPPPPQADSDPMSSVMGIMNQFGLGGMSGDSDDTPAYRPGPKQVSRDTTVLISGCQADETSADVRPTNGGAYGALTKTLTDIQSKDPNISYYDLVSHVRSSLSVGGFSQNPCLETSEDRANQPFICEN